MPTKKQPKAPAPVTRWQINEAGEHCLYMDHAYVGRVVREGEGYRAIVVGPIVQPMRATDLKLPRAKYLLAVMVGAGSLADERGQK